MTQNNSAINTDGENNLCYETEGNSPLPMPMPELRQRSSTICREKEDEDFPTDVKKESIDMGN